MKKFVLGALVFVCLGLGTIFARDIPDSAEISVNDPILLGQATNLKITVLKNGSKMTSYDGTILMEISEEDGERRLKDNERVLPNLGMYKFLPSDLGEKEFQRGLEIKKEGTFYIEVSDLNDDADKVLGKQLIHVVKQSSTEGLKHIDITYPAANGSLIGEKIEILASAPDIPNSEAIVYIDDKPVGTAKVASDGSIIHMIGNISEGQHSLFIEIPDLAGNIMGNSDKIFFTSSSLGNNGIKDVFVRPETGFMVGDMVNITVYTDDMVELVKMKLSDRSDNDSIVMDRVGLGEFNQNVWLIGSGDVYLSFDLSSSNNTINESYDNYEVIKVSDLPSIVNLDVVTDIQEKSAVISWEVQDKSIISSYLIDWRIEGTTLSGKDWSETTSFRFKDVPYDTLVSLNITPYWDNQSKHGAASKTIQFVVSKKQEPDSCGNGICENGESHELCSQDCDGEGSTTVISGPSCPPQHISAHTTKIGDSYYLVRDKIENVKKYIVYSSSTPDGRDKTKVYETTDTSYEYPFDHSSEKDIYMYFRIIGVCEDGEELELTGATKVQVGPAENFFLLMCLTFLIYFGIKLFRQTEE